MARDILSMGVSWGGASALVAVLQYAMELLALSVFSFLAGAVWEGMGIRMGTELRMALALASCLWDRDGFTYGKGVRG